MITGPHAMNQRICLGHWPDDIGPTAPSIASTSDILPRTFQVPGLPPERLLEAHGFGTESCIMRRMGEGRIFECKLHVGHVLCLLAILCICWNLWEGKDDYPECVLTVLYCVCI